MVEDSNANANIKCETAPLWMGNGVHISRLADMKGTVSEGVSSKLKKRIWQIFPSFCACLISICFGLMLGWCSPMYPHLIRPDGIIYITMDQSAMIAGMLMIGNTVATPFAYFYHLGPKYGIIIGAFLMTAGWIVMWQAQDIYWLISSRILVGLGNGYGLGQLKSYIKEMTDDNLTQCFIKQINLFVIFGIFIGYAVGPFVHFRVYGMFSLIFTLFILFVCILLPHTPRELYLHGKIRDCKRLIKFLAPYLNPEYVIANMKADIENPPVSGSFSHIFKESELRKNFLILSILIFCQQFTGFPSTIVYCQCIFMWFNTPHPEIFAIIYMFIYYLVNTFCIFVIPWKHKKAGLLISNVGVSLLLSALIAVLYFNVDFHWRFTSPVIICLYMVLHAVGLGYLPSTLIEEYFPSNLQTKVNQYYVMVYSMFALIITKIFQVLVTHFQMYIPFSLFLGTSVFSLIFIALFVPRTTKKR